VQTAIKTTYKAIVIGGSAGSFQGIIAILQKLPDDFPLPIVMCFHRPKHVRSGFAEAIAMKSNKRLIEPEDKEKLYMGKLYIAPANYHLSLDFGNRFALSTEEVTNNCRPAIDFTLDSMSYLYRNKLIGILLSGANSDGAIGMKNIKNRRGLTIVQDPEECMIETMPRSAMKLTSIDYVMKIDTIIEFLHRLNSAYSESSVNLVQD